MGILSWILLGLVAGALAKFIMPGDDPGGVIVTIIIGIAGAVVGGFLGSMLLDVNVTGFNLSSLLIAIVGAIVVLAIYRQVKKKPK